MLLIWIVLNGLFPQTSMSVTKYNGDVIKLREVAFIQTKSVSDKNSLAYSHSGKKQTIEISRLKRINFKDQLDKKKGVSQWMVILVKESNDKLEVQMDLIEISGINPEGEVEVISASDINKITL